ncbi:hypothetical protein LTR97_004250 [Elasticomyces elasticus]|uniref:AB hydrolase-1 domain-containing protein n=1 Tax=Elasticomyces elasticus TaxID=574655 RepID=A0AAN7W9Y1_9PEZI|nr:hypothetical protein LTR97_004250 [Elasticomyces elasticus]
MTENTKERTVEFLSDGHVIRGVLGVPDGDGPFPIVILGQGLAGLKEWTLPEVGAALIQVGIAAMWFDYRNFGDSDGLPRDEVSHYGRLQDWHDAISYAASLPEVDVRKLGIWGTSLGGRDVLAVAAIDRRVIAVVSQTPLIKWTPALAARMAGYGTDLERFFRDLADDRTKRTLAEAPCYVPVVKASGDDAKAAFIAGLSEGDKRNYSGRVTLQSYQPTTLVDIIPLVELISPTPVLFILAEQDFLPGQKEAYHAAKEPKSLDTIGGDHFGPYTVSKSDSIMATTGWFKKRFLAESMQ